MAPDGEGNEDQHQASDPGATGAIGTQLVPRPVAAGHEVVGMTRSESKQAAVYDLGGLVKSEQDTLDLTPAPKMAQSLAAIRHLEAAVVDADWVEGLVLRYGAFYGPGTSMSPGGEQFEMVRKRKFPVVGNGAGVWSFVHIADAAARPPRR